MNILILTGKFGLGHYSAAEAIKQQMLAEDPTNNIQVIDFIDYMFPEFKEIIYGTFNFMVGKCHAVYNFFNEAASKHSEVPLKRTVSKRLHALLEENETDIVVSAFPVCPQYISAYKKMFGNKIPLYTCITDIEAHDEWITPETDVYFVSTEQTRRGLIAKGVPENKIVISGIPVRPVFETRERFISDRKEVLIMGGGLGLIPSIDLFLDALSRQSNVNVTIIAGNNEKLYKELKESYSGIDIVGFTTEVDRYMKKADLIITKAGGITLFEAMHTETPLFIIRPFLSQEVGNAEYIEANNIGRVSWDKNGDVTSEIMALINDDRELHKMKRNMRKITDSFNKVSYIHPLEQVGVGVC